MEPQYAWIIIFCIIIYVVFTDENVLRAIGYVSQLTESKFRKATWWLRNNPSNPIVKYFIWRRSMETAKRIRKSLNDKTK